MKKIFSICLLMVLLILTGCMDSFPSPTPKVNISPTFTFKMSTATPLPYPTATTTVTSIPPLPTLGPKEAEQAIAKFMKENNNCTKPCFWGLFPIVTPFNEATRLIDTLGPGDLVEDGIYRYDDRFIRNKINIEILLSGMGDELESIYVAAYRLSEVNNEDWLAFRPDTILRSYGVPSNVGFYFVETPFGQLVEFVLFYEYSNEYKFSIQYGAGIIKDSPEKARVCLLESQQIDRFDLWLGKNFKNAPQYDATSSKVMWLSPEEFYYRMVGEAKNACIELNMKSAP